MENWIDKKVKLKEKFSILLDSDLIFTEGNKDEMLSKVQIKLGITREELLRVIEGL